MMKEKKVCTYVKDGNSYNFNLYTDLRISEKAKFVNSVVSLIVDANNYNSIIRDIIFDFYTVDFLTEIDTNDLKNSSFFVNDVENFFVNNNIIDVIKVNVSSTLLDELNKAVDDSIEYLTGIHKNYLNEALVSLVNTLERKVNNINLNEIMDMAQKFNSITDDFTTENIVNAYINSDIHKNNLIEIEQDKVDN